MSSFKPLNASIRFWHPNASADAIESAFGRTAKRKSTVGELRTRGDRSPYRDSHCCFDLEIPEDCDFEHVVMGAVSIISSRWKEAGSLIESGGPLYITVGVPGAAIEFSLESETIEALGKVKAGIWIQVYD